MQLALGNVPPQHFMVRNWEVMEPVSRVSPSAPDQFYVIRVLWHRRGRVLFGLVLGLALGLAYYRLAEPKYESIAQLLFVHKTPQSVPGLITPGSNLDEYLAVHEALMRSPVVIQEAIQQANLDTLPALREELDVTQAVIEGLTVQSASQDNRSFNPGVIDLAFRCANERDCQTVLQAVIQSYHDYLRRSQEDDSSTVRSLFHQWSNEIRNELAAKEQSFKALLAESPTVVLEGPRAVSLSQERLARIESQKIEQMMRLMTAERQLKALEDARAAGVQPSVVDQLAAIWGSPTNSDISLQKQFLQLLFQEQKLMTQYGPRHPELLAIRKQIELLQNELPEDKDMAGNQPSASTVYTYALQHERDVARELTESFGQLIATEQSDAKQNSDRMVEIEQLRSDIASLQELYKEISRQIQALDLVKGSEAFEARLIAPPQIGLQVSPQPVMVAAVGTFVGLLLGGVLCFVAEMLDQSIRSPSEVRRRLASGVVGIIPPLKRMKRARVAIEANGRAPHPMVWTFHRPDSSEAEAFRALRTSVVLAQRCGGHRVIQITSPNMSDGKSTVAANLATSLAQSKQRVLLVEANFRSPTLHELLPVDHSVGLANLLAGEVRLEEAIQTTAVPGLSVLPSGTVPRSSAELLTGWQLHDVLKQIREEYDFVLVDTPGLLAVSDAWMVVPYVDGVLLVVGDRSQWPHVTRAKEILDSLHAHTLGVVLNGREFQSEFNDFSNGVGAVVTHAPLLEYAADVGRYRTLPRFDQ